MAVLKYKNKDGQYVPLTAPIDIRQETGTSTTAVMSQNAVTVELGKINDAISGLTGDTAADIEQLKTDVANNKTAISANTESITGINSSIATITGDINTIKTVELPKKLEAKDLIISASYPANPDTDETSPVKDTRNMDLYVKPNDTYERAFLKLHKAILDDEEVVSKTFSVIRDSTGLNDTLQYVPKVDSHYVNQAKSITSAVAMLDKQIFTMHSYEGVNTVESVSAITATKKLCVVNMPNGETNVSLPSNLTPPVGDELHIIIYNNSGADRTISFSINYTRMSGDSMTIPNTKYGEINIVYDGTKRYLRHIV